MKYYLRAGDFRPEEVTLENMKLTFGKYVSFEQAKEYLFQSNNSFPTIELAEKASLMIRSLLASLAICSSEPARLGPQTQRLSGNSLQPLMTVCFQIPYMGILTRCDEPQGPTE
ncbi:MAG: hypothetical protein K2H22_04450 [Muribaculaceae bacterium]|nr:hypothetical protein [Muribaculaceae bacterium]